MTEGLVHNRFVHPVPKLARKVHNHSQGSPALLLGRSAYFLKIKFRRSRPGEHSLAARQHEDLHTCPRAHQNILSRWNSPDISAIRG